MKKHVQIFTDGACRGNPGPGGWGAILRFGSHEKEIYGAVDLTTNNRMELSAAIEALKAVSEACQIDLYTDSKYVQQGISEWLAKWKQQGWKTAARKPVKNIDLWQQLDELVAGHHISWHWVKGHSGHPENERADALANLAMDQLLKKGNG